MIADFRSPSGNGGFQGRSSTYGGSIGDINDTPYFSRNVDRYLTPGITPGSATAAGASQTPYSANSRLGGAYYERDNTQQSSVQSRMASQSLLFGRSNSYQLDPPNAGRSSSNITDSLHHAERVEFAPINSMVSIIYVNDMK